jgi:hypothetical protein
MNNPAITIPIRINITAGALGMPFRCIQNNGGMKIMAINMDRRKGTRIELAARIPATKMTKHAAVIRKRPTLDIFPSFSINSTPHISYPKGFGVSQPDLPPKAVPTFKLVFEQCEVFPSIYSRINAG